MYDNKVIVTVVNIFKYPGIVGNIIMYTEIIREKERQKYTGVAVGRPEGRSPGFGGSTVKTVSENDGNRGVITINRVMVYYYAAPENDKRYQRRDFTRVRVKNIEIILKTNYLRY